jgi:hypothetical protein
MELLGHLVQIEARFGLFRDSANLDARSIWRQCQCRPNIGAWFAPNVPWAWKSLWAHPMDLLGGVGQMKAHFGPFGGSVNIDARLVHGLR